MTDNAELILMRDAMDLLLPRVAKVVSNLCKLAREWKATPTLAYTHLQPGNFAATAKLVEAPLTIDLTAQLITGIPKAVLLFGCNTNL